MTEDIGINVSDGAGVEDELPFADIPEEPKVDASLLANWMLDWEKKRKELDVLEDLIKSAVLDYGKTFVIGNIRATYSAGRKKYLWEQTARTYIAPESFHSLELAHKIWTTDWKGMVSDANVEPLFEQGKPYVSIKLEGGKK